MMPFLEEFLYRFSNAILMPTLAAVIALAAWTAVMFGGLLREWLGRRQVRATLLQLRKLPKVGPANDAQLLQCLSACPVGLPLRLSKKLREWPLLSERAKNLEDLELEAMAILSRLLWITRIAPMLGLMGTLIPLGPALTALAAGDIAKLSTNLVVAFTTTVVGVFLGSAAFSICLLRKGWYARDLSDLEHVFAPADERPEYAPQNS